MAICLYKISACRHRFKLLPLFLFCLLVFLSGCSLQKRRYRSGFYVSAASHRQKHHTPLQPCANIRENTPVPPTDFVVSASAGGTAAHPVNCLRFREPVLLTAITKSRVTTKQAATLRAPTPLATTHSATQYGEPEKRVSPFAAAGFALSILSFLPLIAAAILINMLAAIALLMLLATIALAVAGFILCAKAVFQKANDPDAYRIGYAIAGMVISTVIFLFLGLLLFEL